MIVEYKSQKKHEKVDEKHDTKWPDSQPLFKQFHAWDQGRFSATESPFRPRMNQHDTLLATAPSDEVRTNLLLRLQESYGNTYAQRLIESVIQKKQVHTGRIRQFLDENPGHEDLFQGIIGEMADFSIVNHLLNNFYKRGDFQYTGTRLPPWSHQGDCATLVLEFKTIADQCFQIEVKVGRSNKPIFVPGPKSQIGDKRTGNVNSGQDWIYDEHYWIVFDDKPIDILFGHWDLGYFEGEYDMGKLEYHFNDKVYYFNRKAKDLSDVYTLNPKNRAKNTAEIPQF